MNLKKALPWLVLAAVVGFAGWKLHASHFDWVGFGRSLRTADLRLIALAAAAICCQNVFRAMRWAVFLRPMLRQAGMPRVAWWRLVGSQFIGFAGLSIFGRVGELIRPLLVARRTGLTFSSQVAVVAVERVFDLGAFGAIFAVNLLLAPELRGLPYLHKAGMTIAALTVGIGLFVVGVRVAGGAIAGAVKWLVGLVSKAAGEAVAAKVLSFRDGLNVIDSAADFGLATGLSFVLWATIAACYVLVLRAFPAPVHDMTVGDTIVLMGFSIAGSALPIPGGSGAWAAIVLAMTELFHIPAELAWGAGMIVWLVLNMSVVPGGLVYAKLEGVSLGQVVKVSETGE